MTTDEQRTLLQMVSGEKTLDHGIGGALTSLKKLGLFPSEIGVDLLVVAAHVHAADTRISRAEQSQDSWTREIRLVIPVSDPVRWTGAIPTLTKTLNFLTGDRWTVGFRAQPPRFATIVQEAPPTLLAPPFDVVSLFSGGLDSLIGAIDLLEGGATPLLVSHFGEGATSDAQGKLFAVLKKHYNTSSFERLRVPVARSSFIPIPLAPSLPAILSTANMANWVWAGGPSHCLRCNQISRHLSVLGVTGRRGVQPKWFHCLARSVRGRILEAQVNSICDQNPAV